VTHDLTGSGALMWTRPRAPAGPGPTGVAGLIRSVTVPGIRRVVSHHSRAVFQPDRNHARPIRTKEVNAMPSLAERVDVVIGVDTHKNTHTAAAVAAATGAKLDELTIGTDSDGYAALLTWAQSHPGDRVWSLEGAGGYGAGLARFLAAAGEVVLELDRPVRAARRNGAKSDPLDAVRAAREALSREHLAEPKTDGPRAQLAALMAAAGPRSRPPPWPNTSSMLWSSRHPTPCGPCSADRPPPSCWPRPPSCGPTPLGPDNGHDRPGPASARAAQQRPDRGSRRA
jgi:Transposase